MRRCELSPVLGVARVGVRGFGRDTVGFRACTSKTARGVSGQLGFRANGSSRWVHDAVHKHVRSGVNGWVCAREHACWSWCPWAASARAERGRGMAYGGPGRQGLIGRARRW
jgi:hypothetical protein